MLWQSSKNNGGWSLLVFAVTLSLTSFPGQAVAEEPCNPIIDGTYCATNMPKHRAPVDSARGMTPLGDYTRLVPSAVAGGTPGTLFGISVQGDRTCFGLLRRSTCH